MALLLGIDLGTSYFKVGLFDETGVMQGLGRVAVDAESPGQGRVELGAEDFWGRLRQALAVALDQAGATVRQIAAVSYSSQANTFILLDAKRRALTPLVFWNDQRASPLEPRLTEFGSSRRHADVTGLSGAAPDRAPAKWRWFARNDPSVWSRTAHALTLSDYFTFSLTGQRVGDASTAVLTGLYDLREGRWWSEALQEFGVEQRLLADPLRPGLPCGRTSAGATDRLGLAAGIPFAVGALDHHAAALGSGLGSFADASLSTGTVLAALVLVDHVTAAPGCIHGPHVDGQRFYRLTFDPNGAGQLEKYRAQHAPELDVGELVSLAARLPSALAGAECERHGAAVRELLESMVAAQQQLLLNAAGGAAVRSVTATGGGARSPLLLQMQADRLGVTVVTAEGPERACLGAALFAAVAANFFPDVATAARTMVRRSRDYRSGEAVSGHV